MDNQNEYGRLDDLQLIERVRAGDSNAYSELWLRYKQVGLYTARNFSSSFEPEDIVAEAHVRIFKALREGKGPTTHFRPYLVTTIQNLSRRWGQTQNDTTVTDFDEILDADPVGDFTDASLEKMMLQRAFLSLPTRWQQALWHLEVNEGSTEELAESLGIRPNAAAALAYRAREGLKQAWIDAHLNNAANNPECQPVVRQLGGYERKTLSKKTMARISDHLSECHECSSLQREASHVGQMLKSALLPTLLAGAISAGTALPTLFSGTTATQQSHVGTVSTHLSHAAVASVPKMAIAAATAIATVIGVTVLAATQLSLHPTIAGPLPTATSFVDGPPQPGHTQGDDAHNDELQRPTNRPESENRDQPAHEVSPAQNSVPEAPVIYTENGAILLGSDIEITGSALPKAEVTLFVSGNRTGYQTRTVTANEAGGWSARLNNSAEGGYLLRAYQTNASNQRSALSSTFYRVAWGTPEAAPTITNVDTSQGTLAPSLSGTGVPGNTVLIRLNGIVTTQPISSAGYWSAQVNAGSLVGTNELTVAQQSPTTKKQSLSTDPIRFELEAPIATIVSEQPGSLALSIISQAHSDVLIQDPEGGFSHTVLSTTGADSLRLMWTTSGGDSATTAVQIRYSGDDGNRLGPVALFETTLPETSR